jgi:hypothetical protein
MRPLRKLWPALEALPGLAAVTEEWRERLGEDFEAGQELLRLTNRRAEAYPCPSPGGIGCSRSIVDHGNGRIVAVCGDQPKRCDRLTLNKRDIAIYELDTRKLGTAIAVAFGIDPGFNEITGLQQTYRVGDYHPQAGKRFPLFLTFQTDPASLRDVATRLCATTDTAFILVIPTTQFSDLAMMDLLGRQKARGMALADLFENDGAGKLVATEAAKTLLAEFHSEVMPEEEVGQLNQFPTPPEARWEDISIEFIAEEVANIRCKGITRRVEPEHLGVKSRKNGKPTLQWTLLQSFARCNGSISWNDSDAKDRVKHQKLKLSKKLNAYFGIEDAPINWHRDERDYRTRFSICWPNHS